MTCHRERSCARVCEVRSLRMTARTARLPVAMLFLVGCASTGKVTRVMDGRVLEGKVIQPEGYSAFLRGALAEEAGQLPAALAAYSQAASLDADDPEVWSRLGEVRCRLSPKDPDADTAFTRALKADKAYEPALEARARCAALRGNGSQARADEERAAAADPRAPAPQALLAGGGGEGAEAARVRLIALTLLHGTDPVAWDALAAWGVAHRDPEIVARALVEISRIAPTRKWELGGRAVALAGDGNLPQARALAAALVDAPGDRSSGGEKPSPATIPLVARLAVDEALARRDVDAARRRATSAHLGLDVAAGRALLLGEPELARDLAEPVVLADPGAMGARIALATAAARLGKDSFGQTLDLARSGRLGTAVVVEALLPFAKVVEGVASPEVARRVLEGSKVSLLPGDALVTSTAVDLAAAGVLREDDLPTDARIELAARLSSPLPVIDANAGVDARHLLFAWALEKPHETATVDLARRLGGAAVRDPLVAVALARLSIAQGWALAPNALDPLLAVDPADPILAAAALDLAKRSGDARAIAPARARLAALARTPRERAHALE
jgi:tetratricopeptide (TPR) repeat protein